MKQRMKQRNSYSDEGTGREESQGNCLFAAAAFFALIILFTFIAAMLSLMGISLLGG